MFEVCPPDSLLHMLTEQCNNQELSDVTIELPNEDRKLYAHKLILCSQSEVFKTMLLQTNMAEGRSNCIRIGSGFLAPPSQERGKEKGEGEEGEEGGEGEEGSLSYETMHKILRFMYLLPIYCSDLDECFAMMSFAHQFMLPQLFAALKDGLKGKVGEENVLEILPFARHHGAADLEEVCWRCLDARAGALLLSPGFYALEEPLLCDLLQRELLVDEVPLFEAVLEWGRTRSSPKKEKEKENGGESSGKEESSDNTKLRETLKNILPSIRFPQMDRQYLIGKVKPQGLLPADLYIEALEYIALGAEGGSLGGPFNKRLKPRGGLVHHPPQPSPPSSKGPSLARKGKFR